MEPTQFLNEYSWNGLPRTLLKNAEEEHKNLSLFIIKKDLESIADEDNLMVTKIVQKIIWKIEQKSS